MERMPPAPETRRGRPRGRATPGRAARSRGSRGRGRGRRSSHQRPLGRGDLGVARRRGRFPKRPGERLGDCLGGMVPVAAREERGVEVQAPAEGHGLEELLHEGEGKVRRHEQHLSVEGHFPREVRAAREVHDDAGEGLVERDVRVAEAADPALVAQRLLQGLAKREAGVLDRVMEVDVNIAFRLDGETDPGVARDRVQHVVEESHGRRDLRRDPAGRSKLQPDRGLLRRALDGSHVHAITSLQAVRNKSFSSGRPTVTRRAGAFVPATLRTSTPRFQRASSSASAGRSGRRYRKLAWDSEMRPPGFAESALAIRSRSERIVEIRAAVTFASDSAASAAALANRFTENGGTTFSTSRSSVGSPSMYPTRTPASAAAFDRVLEIRRFGKRRRRSLTLAPPGRPSPSENSMYASSIKTNAPVSRRRVRPSRGKSVPVGLLGEQRPNGRSGSRLASESVGPTDGERPPSSSGKLSTAAPAARAQEAYSPNVGGQSAIRRPGAPEARKNERKSELDPSPTITCSAGSPSRFASASFSSDAYGSGYRDHFEDASRARTCSRRRAGISSGLSLRSSRTGASFVDVT